MMTNAGVPGVGIALISIHVYMPEGAFYVTGPFPVFFMKCRCETSLISVKL